MRKLVSNDVATNGVELFGDLCDDFLERVVRKVQIGAALFFKKCTEYVLTLIFPSTFQSASWVVGGSAAVDTKEVDAPSPSA